MTDTVPLPGLQATNLMGYLAAIGTLAAVGRMHPDAPIRLSWTAQATPTAVLHGLSTLPEVITAVMQDRDHWVGSPALEGHDHGDVKFAPADLRRYLQTCRDTDDGGRSVALAGALVAEGSLDGKGTAKPTDLHFTAGQQRFTNVAIEVRDGLKQERLQEALTGPWRYDSPLKSFMWDVTDARIYALSATDPSQSSKRSVPGAEWLALMGVVAFPATASPGRTRIAGAGGRWKRGSLQAPVWSAPVSLDVVRSLLSAARPVQEGLGVPRGLRWQITRSDQGGYGSAGPAADWADATAVG